MEHVRFGMDSVAAFNEEGRDTVSDSTSTSELLNRVPIRRNGDNSAAELIPSINQRRHSWSDSTDILISRPLYELLDDIHISSPVPHDLDPGPDVQFKNISDLDEVITTSNDATDPSFRYNSQIQGDLHMLYNNIQVFLIRNKMSLEFLKIFKKYVSYLIADGFDPYENDFVLRIQHELDGSYKLSSVLKEILNVFLLKPNTLLTKLTHWEYSNSERNLKKYFRFWLYSYDVKESLRIRSSQWDGYVIGKWFDTWRLNYSHKVELPLQDATQFDEDRLANNMWDIMERKMILFKAQNDMASNYLAQRVWNKIKSRRDKIKTMQGNVEVFLRQKDLANAIRFWKLAKLAFK